jgi:hypothetical protein
VRSFLSLCNPIQRVPRDGGIIAKSMNFPRELSISSSFAAIKTGQAILSLPVEKLSTGIYE